LGVSQFSGVFGAQGDSKEQRELLRRNLRPGSATDEVKRNMQFAWEDDKPPVEESVTFAAEVEGADDVDVIFGETGMQFNWDAAESIQDVGVSQEDEVDDYFPVANSRGILHNHEEDTDRNYYAPTPAKMGKFSKVLGGIDVSSNSKIQKAGKVGKMMWDEEPVVLKGGKSMKKGLKSSKKHKSGKSGYEGRGYYDSGDSHEDSREDVMELLFPDADIFDTHDEENGGNGWFSSFQSTGSGADYGSMFSSVGTEDVVTRSDDFFVGVTERADFEGDSEIKGRQSYTFDDDYFNEDERLVFLPRPVVTLAGSVWSVNPQTVMPPVVPDGSGNTLTLGTEYLFNEVMTDERNINSQLVPIGVDAETVLFVLALDGFCDRIGPADLGSVQGYCFLTYTFIDPQTQLTAGSFTAQGIIIAEETYSLGQLTVVGGTGVMTGATGLVEILPAALNEAINPPLVSEPPLGADPFDGVAGWAHYFEFDVDVLFFLPELYAR